MAHEHSRDALVAELERIAVEGERWAGELDDAQLRWSPAADRWSIGEILEHLVITGRCYRDAIGAVLAARPRRIHHEPLVGEQAPRLAWLDGMFVRSMEPPPRRAFRAPGVFLPLHVRPNGELGAELGQVHRQIAAQLATVEGRDLDRLRIGSPASRFVRFRLRGGVAALCAHARRHLWQIEQVRRSPGFPA